MNPPKFFLGGSTLIYWTWVKYFFPIVKKDHDDNCLSGKLGKAMFEFNHFMPAISTNFVGVISFCF